MAQHDKISAALSAAVRLLTHTYTQTDISAHVPARTHIGQGKADMNKTLLKDWQAGVWNRLRCLYLKPNLYACMYFCEVLHYMCASGCLSVSQCETNQSTAFVFFLVEWLDVFVSHTQSLTMTCMKSMFQLWEAGESCRG